MPWMQLRSLSHGGFEWTVHVATRTPRTGRQKLEFVFERTGSVQHRCTLQDHELEALARFGTAVSDDVLRAALDRVALLTAPPGSGVLGGPS
jgi:hypothetical protein